MRLAVEQVAAASALQAAVLQAAVLQAAVPRTTGMIILLVSQMVFALFFGCLVALFYLIGLLMKGEDSTDNSGSSVRNENNNNIVTVTQVQVAMLNSDGELKGSLNQIAKTSDWQTKHGLNSALQASIEALLAASDNWIQVRCQSKTVRTREEGTRLFQGLSLNERNKFEIASLVNIDGNLQCQDRLPANRPEKDPENDYIVATLILGTAHDQPVISNQVPVCG